MQMVLGLSRSGPVSRTALSVVGATAQDERLSARCPRRLGLLGRGAGVAKEDRTRVPGSQPPPGLLHIDLDVHLEDAQSRGVGGHVVIGKWEGAGKTGAEAP